LSGTPEQWKKVKKKGENGGLLGFSGRKKGENKGME